MTTNHYADYILDILSPLGGMKARKMFGGHGIYQHGIFFALISDDVLYFKVDATSRQDYEAYGSKPFTYAAKDKKTVVLSYWEVPADVLESHADLAQWVAKAVSVARQAKK
jgi:DNA transformation protein and related proteins